MDAYSGEIEVKMRRLYGWLSEKDRRRYAAIEAAKLGHGGIEYIARVFVVSSEDDSAGAEGFGGGH